jgi:hypothetical protein
MAKYFHAIESNYYELIKLYDDKIIDETIFLKSLENFSKELETSVLVEDENDDQITELSEIINTMIAKIGV